jgi:putative sterol carrier protein
MAEPSLENIPGSFAGLESSFLPDKAANVNQTIQFDFTGREAGTWALTVSNGTLSYQQGAASNPNVTIGVDSDDWLKILRQELNPTTAFMSGKLKVTPPTAAMSLLQFQNWFSRPA